MNEVIIQVGDVQAAVSFYTNLCGMSLVRYVEHQGEMLAELDAGGLRVTLTPGGRAGMQLALATASAEADESRLAQAGATMHGGRQQVGAGVWLSFEDPWGNLLGFWQRPPAQPAE